MLHIFHVPGLSRARITYTSHVTPIWCAGILARIDANPVEQDTEGPYAARCHASVREV